MRTMAVEALTRVRGGVFYGWYMVASGFLLIFFTTGIGVYGFAAFLGPIVRHFGWSQAITAGAFSLRSVESGSLSPLMGYLADRVGPRPILVAGFVIEGFGFILLSQVQSLWQFYAAFAILALGLSGGSFLIVSTALNSWFVRLRGRAFALMLMGAAFGGPFLSLFIWLVAVLGWRGALILAGVSLWVFCIPLSLVMRRRPEVYGLRPDGDPDGGARMEQRDPGRVVASAPEVQLKVGSVLRSRSYWQYVLAVNFQTASFGALVLFQVLALESFGLTLPQTAVVVTVWTLASIPGRLVAGFLSDILDKRLVLGGSIALQIIGALIFLTVGGLWMGLAYALVHGVGWGASNPSRLALQGEYWGRNIFGVLMGIQQTVGSAIGVVAPIFVGRWYDLRQDYHGAFLILFAPLIVSFVFILTLKKSTAEAR